MGSANAMTHGAYTPKMPEKQQALCDIVLAQYMRDVVNPSETDKMALERAAMLEAKVRFALADETTPVLVLDILHRILHRELKTLQVTRESKDSRSTGTTPAEVIAAIMMKVQERRTLISTKRITAKDDDERVIDAEFEETPVPAEDPAEDQVEETPDDDQADDQAVEAQADGDDVLKWWP